MMKRYSTLLMCALMVCLCFTCCAQADDAAAQAERTIASYTYSLADGGSEYVENLIFNEDVMISGDNAQIIFSNCEFNGNVILTANEATRALLLGCDINGVCVLRNEIKEASIDYANPKFMIDTPAAIVCEDCVGTLIALGDFEVTFNSETYTMASSELFSDMTAPEAGYVPYAGQEASYYCIAQWFENDQQNTLVVCEYDPSM